MKLKVLYEDNHYLVVFKPAGLLTQGDGQNICLMDTVKTYLKEKYNKPGNVFLGLVHRLDRNVSGLVIFGKTSKGAARLSEQIRTRTIQKVYQALVETCPSKPSGELVNFLLKDQATNTVAVVPPGQGLEARLEYKILKKMNSGCLLEVKLLTGRSHQIRVQLANIGCPIIGDSKYGSTKKLTNRQIALCAVSLTFKLATKDETVTIKTDNDFLVSPV